MPVEDLQHLHQISARQNYPFIVDSRDRNRAIYPAPEEYVVEFTQPFTNVVRFEVIDAQLPRTMYNIDIYNNTLSFFIYDTTFDMSTLQSNAFTTVQVEPGDYTIHTLLPAMNAALQARVNGGSNTPLASITVSSVSQPPEVKNQVQLDCPYSFMLNMKASTLAESLGFDLYAVPTETVAYSAFTVSAAKGWSARQVQTFSLLEQGFSEASVIDSMALYVACNIQGTNTLFNAGTIVPIGCNAVNISSTNTLTLPTWTEMVAMATTWVAQVLPFVANYQVFQSVDMQTQTGRSHVLFEGPRAVVQTLAGTPVAQRFTTTVATNLTLVEAAFRGAGAGSGAGSGILGQVVDWRLYVGSSTTNAPDPARVVWDTTVTASTADSLVVKYVDGTYSSTSNVTVPLAAATTYWLELLPPSGVEVYINDVVATETTLLSRTVSAPPTWASIDTPPNIFYKASMRITSTDNYHRILAPGLFSLVGPRYCVLRCKEIEENSHRSLAYQAHYIGIAKFNMDVVGYGNMTMNERFTNYQRDFHPIGKLTRLTLRLELPSGKLYRFRGVNHTLMMAITYLEPIMKISDAVSFPLNPNYNPNFMEYQFGNEGDDDLAPDMDPTAYRDAEEQYARGRMAADMPVHRFQDREAEQEAYFNARWPPHTSALPSQNPPPWGPPQERSSPAWTGTSRPDFR